MTETQYRRVGKFELHELIGEGAMGAVWKAYDSVVRRYVALKLLPSAVGRSTDARDRFLREARAAGALQHPNIVTLYELGEEDRQLFIAMELVDGHDLSSLIALREPLALERKLDIVIEVLQGLSYAHERVVSKAMNKVPEERYETARQMQSSLFSIRAALSGASETTARLGPRWTPLPSALLRLVRHAPIRWRAAALTTLMVTALVAL